MPHWAKATDRNQGEIIWHLIAAGWEVLDLSKAGWGVLDLIARKRGLSIWVECKMPGETLTQRESKFYAVAPGDKVIAFSGMDAVTQCELILRGRGM